MQKVIEHILQRESRWIAWKNAACPAYERSPADVKVGGESMWRFEEFIRLACICCAIVKRKAEEDSMEASVAAKTTQKSVPSITQLSKKYATESTGSTHPTMAVSKDSLASAYKEPDFDSLVDTYLEADDPDAGIEEEYHPKHNQYVVILIDFLASLS